MHLPSIQFSRQRRTVLGMDIGADGVRLVAADRRGGHFEVDWIEEVSLTELQGFADYDSVLAKLEDVIAPRVKGSLDVATVPPWNSARVVIEEMPAMDAARFHHAARWYFQKHAQEDMLDPVNRGIPQPSRATPDGKEVVDGIMVSLDEVMMRGLADLCQKLDLRLQWLVPSALCYPALLRAAGDREHRALFLDIGAGQSRMTLSVDGTVRLVRKLKTCANDLVRDLGDELGLDWSTANQALLAHSGLGPLADDDPDGVAARARTLIDPTLDRLAESLKGEILRSAAYVEARHGEVVDRVFLSGGLGGASGLIERLAPDLHLELAPLDPFAACATPPDLPGPARTHFALATGAAALALERRDDVNLLLADRAPATERRRATAQRRWTPRRVAALGTSVLAMAVVVGADLHQDQRIDRLETERSRLEQEQIQLRVRARELTAREDLFAIEGRVESLRALYRSRRLFTPFFTQVVACLPETARLDRISIQHANAVSDSLTDGPVPLAVHLGGRTGDVDAVGEFVVELEDLGLLSRIEVLRILERDGEQQGRWYDFEIRGEPVVPRQEEFIAAHAEAMDTPEVAR
ncbi:MAG TPA: hypothetical protein VKA86_00295 [Candidatus Krumholzibacteria bacterium]|nr:hypothetical protein [Candidatus Krumholzibacteria bacterium]